MAINIPLIAGLAGLGAIQGISKSAQQKAQNQAAAAQTRYSPWTGFGVGQIQPEGNFLGDALAGGLSGYALDQSMIQNDLINERLKSGLWGPLPSVEPASRWSTWDILGKG